MNRRRATGAPNARSLAPSFVLSFVRPFDLQTEARPKVGARELPSASSFSPGWWAFERVATRELKQIWAEQDREMLLGHPSDRDVSNWAPKAGGHW